MVIVSHQTDENSSRHTRTGAEVLSPDHKRIMRWRWRDITVMLSQDIVQCVGIGCPLENIGADNEYVVIQEGDCAIERYHVIAHGNSSPLVTDFNAAQVLSGDGELGRLCEFLIRVNRIRQGGIARAARRSSRISCSQRSWAGLDHVRTSHYRPLSTRPQFAGTQH